MTLEKNMLDYKDFVVIIISSDSSCQKGKGAQKDATIYHRWE